MKYCNFYQGQDASIVDYDIYPMNDLLDPEKNVEKDQQQDSQFSQKAVYVREDDQDWGSSGMNNIQTDSE